MEIFRAKAQRIRGTSYAEIHKKAVRFYHSIASKTKRKPYVRSAYFNGKKVFLSLFFDHLKEKSQRDRQKRLSYLPLAIDLIKNSKQKPESKENPNKPSEILHRFMGLEEGGSRFFVQIKEGKNSGKKYLISFYPGH